MAEGPSSLPAGSSSPDDPVMRILLMGRKRSGKSSSGNTILGQNLFKVHKQKKKAEDEFVGVCEKISQINEKQVHVIDTPDLLDPDLTKEVLENMKEKLIALCTAGLSAVLLIVPLGKNVENEEEILDFFKHLFGPEVQNYVMVLFTCGDELDDDDTIDTYLTNEDNADLQQLVTECGGRFHCFNNKREVDDQVTQLLQKIERMAAGNGGTFIMAQMKRSDSKEIDIDFSGDRPAEELAREHQIPERKNQIRLVLLGKTGVGKSSTGNTILGRNVFESSASSNSLTKQCSSETNVRIGKEISVIDTPGLFDNKLSEEEVIKEMVKCITHSSPGPHAFLIVIQVGRFTEEEKNTVEQLKEVFGEHLEKYTIILFTHKDKLKKNESIEEFLQNGDQDLKTLVERCGNRFFALNNNSASYPQFIDLLGKIEMMVAENRGHFTNDMFSGTEEYIQEVQKHNLEEKVKHYQQEHKEDHNETEWQRIYWRLAEESRDEAVHSLLSEVYITAVAKLLKKVDVTAEERESAIKEAESKGISRKKAIRLAVRATGTLAWQKMCGIQ